MKADVHLAIVREPILEGFSVGGGSNRLKVRLRIRQLAVLPVLAEAVEKLFGALKLRPFENE